VSSPGASQLLRTVAAAALIALGAATLVQSAADAPSLTLTSIVSIRPDGTDAETVADGPAYNFAPATSPDGRQLSFVRSGPDGLGLWVAAADGSAAHRIAELDQSGGAVSTVSTWSPNGHSIAFDDADAKACAPDQLPCRIRRVRKVEDDGTNATVVAEATVTTRGADAPTWSPDGEQLAFVGLVDTARRTGAIDVAGTAGTRRHTVLPGTSAGCPAWSPDGRWIAYARLAGAGSVRLISPDGRARKRIHAGGCGFAWSPTGKRLAFVDRGWLYVISAAGTGLRRLARSRSGGLSWSPRGDAIAFLDGRQLAVVHLPNRQRRTLIRACVSGPVWSRNGRIYFAVTAPC
jgi:Tol biopolymer transport system component